MYNKIESQCITFRQLREDDYTISDDRYGIAEYVLTPSRISAGLACPFAKDEDVAMMFITEDGTPVSRAQLFPTQVLMYGELFPCGTGSSLETAPEYRHTGVGGDVLFYIATNKNYPFSLASGISEQALPLYKAIKYFVLEFPRIMLLRNTRPILSKIGLRGRLGNLAATICNVPLKAVNGIHNSSVKRFSKCYTINKVTKVPDWVDDIVRNEGSRFMEYHDHKWLQWCLDYNFRGLERDIQSFYAIEKDGKNLGFFMTKERYRENAGGIKDVLIGSIVEWGVEKDSGLTEYDIIKLALPTFSKDLDIIETATADENTVKAAKRLGFIKHGFAHIALKDKKKQFKDAKDIKNWRVRYGYADVILT